MNIEELLEMVLLVAEMEELKGNKNHAGSGYDYRSAAGRTARDHCQDAGGVGVLATG